MQKMFRFFSWLLGASHPLSLTDAEREELAGLVTEVEHSLHRLHTHLGIGSGLPYGVRSLRVKLRLLIDNYYPGLPVDWKSASVYDIMDSEPSS